MRVRLLLHSISLFLAFLFSSQSFGEVSPVNDLMGSLSVRVEKATDGRPIDIHTLWTPFETLDDDNSWMRSWARPLRAAEVKRIPIFTIPSKRADAQRTAALLEKEGIEAEIIELPEDIEAKVEQRGMEIAKHSPQSPLNKNVVSRYQSAKRYLKDRYEKPNSTEVALGVTAGLYRLGLSSVIWLSAGLNPAIVAALVVGQVAVTATTGIFVRTLDNWYSNRLPVKAQALEPGVEPGVHGAPSGSAGSHRIPPPRAGKASLAKEFGARQMVDLSFAELWRAISGPVGEGHSVASLLGQGEVLSNVLASGGAYTLLSYIRSRKLSRQASMWTSFNAFLGLATLSMLDFSGHHLMTLVDFGFYQFHLSTALIVGAAVGLAAAVHFAPQLFEKMGRMQQKTFEAVSRMFTNHLPRMGRKIKRFFTGGRRGKGGPCDSMFGSLTQQQGH